MRISLAFCLLGFVIVPVVLSNQQPFEPTNFDVRGALLQNGVDISALQSLADVGKHNVTRRCKATCSTLQTLFGLSKLSLHPTMSYWSNQQREIIPHCAFTPDKAVEVSTLVLLSRLTQCPFAVKSGGHAAFAGASNIGGGVLVDLSGLKQRILASDHKTVAIGPGNRWLEVYEYLTPYNLAVVGGRAATVGVGGLTLGGGISHHTNEYGLACDNVASYELVTASGSVILVNQDHYPDLYWALRGGGNNFGIVTAFHYETLPQGLMFASRRRYNASYLPALVDAFVHATEGAVEDTKLAHFFSATYYSGARIVSSEVEYFTPVDTNQPPEIMKEYLAITPLTHDTQNTSLANTTYGLSEVMPDGFRTTMWSQSFKLSTQLLNRMIDHFYKVAPDIPSIAPSISFQAFSKPALAAMQKKGGNALGLDPSKGPFFHVNFYTTWTDPKDDKAIMLAAQSFISTCNQISKELGAYNEYMYMPYSSPYQAVIPAYGAANLERLKAVSKRYDPQSIFQRLQPGYFKFDSAPFGLIVT
ncbi:hypothetical protein BKA66DRAFT_512891 [Pyrenochaeta sp. MPI-SDFR-AT-0127]|nr:hypothetical protein BKA66DRAFT_512891 [Pyrenochaeta sp. MPI-SDFR-AT-0127]